MPRAAGYSRGHRGHDVHHAAVQESIHTWKFLKSHLLQVGFTTPTWDGVTVSLREHCCWWQTASAQHFEQQLLDLIVATYMQYICGLVLCENRPSRRVPGKTSCW